MIIANLPVTRRGFLQATGALGASPFGVAQGPGAPGTSGVRVEKDVVFGTGGAADLRCDIYHPPAGGAKRMALLHYHGGGFTRGSKDGLGPKLTPFAARGYVSIAAQYRLAGVAKWPAPLEDVKACIRWTRANAARLAIDPDHIGLVGYSAGGFLVLHAAGTANRPALEGSGGHAGVSSAVASVFALYPATDVRPASDGTAHALMPPGSDAAAHEAASATAHVASFPPTVLFHGVADTTIRLENSQRLFERLQAANIPAELHAYAGVPHEFDTHAEFADEVARTGDFFLERYVLHPRIYPPFGPGGRRPPPR